MPVGLNPSRSVEGSVRALKRCAGIGAALAEPFRRLSRSVQGFGLGLSIVQAIASAHRGDAVLDPRSEGGLEVTVALPVRAAGAAWQRPTGRDPVIRVRN